MKISGKALLITVYFVITFIATASIQANPQFQQYIDDYIKQIQELGVPGMILYVIVSALLMTFAIPLQFIDLVVGIIYPIRDAILVLIGSKLLGASLSYGIANYFLSEESRRSYTSSKYLKGLHELVRKEPLKYGLLLRFSSIPIIIRNYGLAVLPIKYATYIACVFLQSSVSSPFQAYAGSHFTNFMEMLNSQSNSQQQMLYEESTDENGNIVVIEQHIPETNAGISGTQKQTGMIIVLLGLACSVFVAFKIKRKVEEINKQAEELEAADTLKKTQ